MKLKSCWVDDVPLQRATDKHTFLTSEPGEMVHMGWDLEAGPYGVTARKGSDVVLVPWTMVLSAPVLSEAPGDAKAGKK